MTALAVVGVALLWFVLGLPRRESDLPLLLIVVAILVAAPLWLLFSYLRVALHVLRGRPTVAVDRTGLHVWRHGLTRWDEMVGFQIRRTEWEGDVLVITRERRPGERIWFGRPPRTQINEHLLDLPFTDLLLVMAQYSASARHGSPIEPPRRDAAALRPVDDPERALLVVADPTNDTGDWPGRVHFIGGTVDPAAGRGLHQLDLEPLLYEPWEVVGFIFPQGPLGETTGRAIEALVGREPAEAAPTRTARAGRLVRQYAPPIMGFVLFFVIVRACFR